MKMYAITWWWNNSVYSSHQSAPGQWEPAAALTCKRDGHWEMEGKDGTRKGVAKGERLMDNLHSVITDSFECRYTLTLSKSGYHCWYHILINILMKVNVNGKLITYSFNANAIVGRQPNFLFDDSIIPEWSAPRATRWPQRPLPPLLRLQQRCHQKQTRRRRRRRRSRVRTSVGFILHLKKGVTQKLSTELDSSIRSSVQ